MKYLGPQSSNELQWVDKDEREPGGRLSIKMPSYQYKDPHVKDKTVLRPFYL